MEFPFKLDKFQTESIENIKQGNNVLACVGTGSGKTVIAKYAIAHFMNQGKRVIYTSPIKSLSNQKFAEFKEDFPDLGIMTGDIKFNPDAQCVIMTTEILRNMLFNNSESLDNLGCVVFDEVHYINNPERGKVWEETIILLPNDILMVMLSATIKNPDKFSSWLNSIKEKETKLIIKVDRVIPLTHYYYIDDRMIKSLQNKISKNPQKKDIEIEQHIESNKLIEILDKNNRFKEQNYDIVKKLYDGMTTYNYKELFNPFIRYLKERNLLPALFFCFSRKNCENFAKDISVDLIDHEQEAEINKIFDLKMHSLDTSYEHMEQYYKTKDLVLKGIGVHHSGLIPVLKEIIEILFAKGLIRVLFATETFAVGVNMPTKTVVFTELCKFDGSRERLRNLRTDEYQQMAGRAGRRGLDTIGTVIHLGIRDYLPTNDLKNVMLGSMPEIVSKFGLSYQFILKVIHFKKDDSSIMDFIDNTLLETETAKNTDILRKEREKITEELNNLQAEFDNCEIINHNMENILEYCKMEDILNSELTLKPKQRKKIINQLENLSKNKNDFMDQLEKYKIIKDLYNKIINIEKDIDYYTKHMQNTIELMIDFLIKNKYIEYEGSNKLFINKKHLTIKGLIAMQINECNEMTFTEILNLHLLDDLEPEEIIAIIAAFIDERNLDNDSLNLDRIDVPNKVKLALEQINTISQTLMQDEYDNWIEIGTDWGLYMDFIQPAYMWACGNSVKDIYKMVNMYEGNFIKGIIRINKIIDNIIEICEICKNDILRKKLEVVNQLLIRDIVTVESLYIQSN